MTDERLAKIARFAEDDGYPLGSYLPELCVEIDRLRAALTARDDRARQCVEVLGVKIANPSGEPFDELSQAVQIVSMEHSNKLTARDEAIRVAKEALKEIAFRVPVCTMLGDVRVVRIDEIFEIKRIAADGRAALAAVKVQP